MTKWTFSCIITLPGSGTVGRAKLAPFFLRKCDNAMPFVANPNTAQVRLQGVVDSQITINDLYFELSGGGINVANLTTLAVTLEDWWSLNVANLLSFDWSTTRVSALDLSSLTGPSVDVPSSTVGGVSGEAAPNNVAAAVSFRTASRGRSARGRNFVPGIPNSEITLNTLDSGFIGDLLSAYNLLVGAGAFIAGWEWVVASYVSAGVPRVTPLNFPVTSAIMVGNSVRSMRSREIGHGA